MSVDVNKIQQAMRSVVEAHQVLSEFHAEVVALYSIIDEQLGDTHAPITLAPHNEKYIVRYPSDKLNASQNWTPRWIGRFYWDNSSSPEDDPQGEQSASEGAASQLDFNLAFVWIAAYAPDGEANAFSEPECWFGVAHPGQDSRFKDSWDFGRYGVWEKLDSTNVRSGQWDEGKFPAAGKFGSGGLWHAFRVPLSALIDENHIRSLVTTPLLEKYAEVFATRPGS